MAVWERGAGQTLACGTGACATVVAGVLEGRIERHCRHVDPHLSGAPGYGIFCLKRVVQGLSDTVALEPGQGAWRLVQQ